MMDRRGAGRDSPAEMVRYPLDEQAGPDVVEPVEPPPLAVLVLAHEQRVHDRCRFGAERDVHDAEREQRPFGHHVDMLRRVQAEVGAGELGDAVEVRDVATTGRGGP